MVQTAGKKRKLAAPSPNAKTAQATKGKLSINKSQSGDNSASEAMSLVDTSNLDQAIVDCVMRRLRSTVRIRPLPTRCHLTDLKALCPAAVAIRLPWNRARCRHKGVAFLEFASPEAAAKHALALQGSRALGGRELATSVPPVQAGDVSASQYNSRRVVVSSIEGRVTANQLLELAPGAQRVRFPEAGTKTGRSRNAPSVAVLTFAEPRQALAAVLSCQGAVVGSGPTSWMLEKIVSSEKPKHLIDRRTLVLNGIKKDTTDARLLLALPRCNRFERRESGVAVAFYDTEVDCAADLAAWPADDPKLPTVTFGHKKPASLGQNFGRRNAKAMIKPQSAADKNRLIVAGLPQGTKKSTLVAIINQCSKDNSVSLSSINMTSNGRLALINFDTATAAAEARKRLRQAAATSDVLGTGVKLRIAYSLDQLAARRKTAKVPNSSRKQRASTKKPAVSSAEN